MNFKLWLESQYKFNMKRLPLILQGLAAEAVKAGSFTEFKKDFTLQIKHGLYWHWTDDIYFKIDSERGPRDMSSLAAGGMDEGKLMITSDIDAWANYGTRPYAALIDMTEVPRNGYRQVNRGFGNEFFVSDPSKAKVLEVLPRKQAFAKDRQQRSLLSKAINSNEDLEAFYDAVNGFHQERQLDSPLN